MMNRRVALKQALVLMGSTFWLQACMNDPKRVKAALKKLKITGDDQRLIAEIAEIIIPSTDTPGSKVLKVDAFVLLMADDCLNRAEQKRFSKGISSFGRYAEEQLGKSFFEAPPSEREAVVKKTQANKEESLQDTKFAVGRIRQFAIQGYITSEYFMTKVIPYQLVPGHYNGCVPAHAS